MPRSKSRARSKPQSIDKISRQAIKKEHHQRFLMLVKASREQGRMAMKLASLVGMIPEKIPSRLIREMSAAAKRATKPLPTKTIRRTR